MHESSTQDRNRPSQVRAEVAIKIRDNPQTFPAGIEGRQF
jgi:hypothetical protein